MQAPPVQSPQLIAEQAQDPRWFIQGLYMDGDTFYISSGLYGKSLIAHERPETNGSPANKRQKRLGKRYFAEGLTVIGNTIYVLTWKEGTLLRFNKHNFEPLTSSYYRGEGWGLSHFKNKQEKNQLIMSNGSNTLFMRDPDSFAIKRHIKIPDLDRINELEYHNGVLWANRWYDDHLYGIDIHQRCIVAKVDLAPLRQKASAANDHEKVVNGIAYDERRKGLWITGKLWPKRYLIKLPQASRLHC